MTATAALTAPPRQIVSADELRELTDAYASGQGLPLTPKMLEVVRDGAASHITSQAAGSSHVGSSVDTANAAADPAAESLLPLYQQLYGMMLMWALEVGIAADAGGGSSSGSAAAAEALGQLQAAEADEHWLPEQAADASRQEQDAPVAPILENYKQAAKQDQDGDAYEPLDGHPQSLSPALAANGSGARPSSASGCSAGCGLPAAALRCIARRHLVYHCLSDEALWRQRRLVPRLAACLAAARRHPRFAASPELQQLAAALLALGVDRLASQPSELGDLLPVLLQALEADPAAGPAAGGATAARADPGEDAAAGLALDAAAVLAGRLQALSARRRLWQEAHDALLPLAAALLERRQAALARRARRVPGGGGSADAAVAVAVAVEEWAAVAAAARLLYFYVRDAPPAAAAGQPSRLEQALLSSGALRSLVLLHMQLGGLPGAEALRRALLLACAAAPGALAWAAAVPGFGPSLAGPEFRPGGPAALAGALWQALRCAGDEDLLELLEEAAGSPRGVPRLHAALRLMADLHAAAPGRRLWTPAVDAALRQLSMVLREHYGKPDEAAAEAAGAAAAAANGVREQRGEGEGSGSSSSDDEHDERDRQKLGRSAEEQAAVLATRQAQQLQPLCLRLIKELLQKQGAAVKSD